MSSSQVPGASEPSSANSLKMVACERKFVWTIDEINKCLQNSEEDIVSPIFHLGTRENCRMYLKLRQANQGPLKVVGFYVNLQADNKEKIMAYSDVYVVCKNGQQRSLVSGVSVFDENRLDWGSDICIVKSTLLDDAKGYVRDDKLVVYCNIEFVHDMNHMRASISENYPQFSMDFESLLKDETFSDLTLITRGRNFRVHRNILAYRSSEFYKIYICDAPKEKEENKVELDEISPIIMAEMLRFIYCGKVKDFKEISNDLLAASKKYCIHGLTSLCEAELHKNLRLENVVNCLVMADRHNLFSLKKHALEFIGENSIRVINTQGFKNLCKSGNSCLLGEAFSKLAGTQESKKRRLV